MDREGFVKLAVIGIGLVVLSFFVRGFSQLIFGRGVAELLQAPFATIGFLIVVYLFIRATLDAVGIWSVENGNA
ncbi:hypothetical protein GS429_20605 [Natronorubrum sp. JWXQ-INN-674]|uniref:Uncharacterized protein n=1 Tax=Natronorubrum halalkaliphilum TaxID=2691917 RepID=A0A6B0VSQ7_9EURY|nr:hypothetical protein [Natronorubrum halalkaliphilum]MXV64425.1 hypothetical protein [Natronorubrum halalkaliphilum]